MGLTVENLHQNPDNCAKVFFIHICDMHQRCLLKRRALFVAHTYLWQDCFFHVTWFLHICDMYQRCPSKRRALFVAHIYLWHDSFIRKCSSITSATVFDKERQTERERQIQRERQTVREILAEREIEVKILKSQFASKATIYKRLLWEISSSVPGRETVVNILKSQLASNATISKTSLLRIFIKCTRRWDRGEHSEKPAR